MDSLELSFPTGFLASLEIGGRLLLAIALAGLLGWDREEKDRPAGLRTYMLVALASALFTIITFEIYETLHITNPSGSSDPIRIIEAVTAGVAFLAAGTIIQGRTSVRGLTTGAGMWMAGALGVAVGAGHYLLAIFAAGLAFCILRFVNFAAPNDKPPASTLLIDESEEDQRSG
ncbi:MAG: MgtC/SapB family protein [Hyphomicrobium sp.]|uniref:MgtC/SapB family protein n=1 Tax=Hyphomicrobium sp. TaxID=82 RepID=UPI0025C0C647|nr:MgtC/SapB family protein [Hyphomicrobium sp.]MBX9861857.1 MgtC/SapB family protein [Hyphomicrobium sp.]